MKGGTVAAAVALRELVETGPPLQGDVVLAATAGEETDSCGVERFMTDHAWLPDLAGIIIPEPTDFTIVNAHRGLLWLQITTQGKTAHGSTPQLGINAIETMQTVIQKLKSFTLPGRPHPKLGQSSTSMNTITGGKALNVVPDQCTLGVDIRTLPDQDHQKILLEIQRLLTELHTEDPQCRADVSVKRSVGALETDAHAPFVQTLCDTVGGPDVQAVGFTTDGPSVARLGVPILIFGPGKGSVCHQPDESISLADVARAVDLYKRIMLRFLTESR